MAGATQTASDHATAQAANQEFLTYAASVPRPTILGNIASGATGGANSPVVWSRVLPVVPRWVEAIQLDVSLPYTITVPTGGTGYVSPFAPYSVIQNRFSIAGSPPWDYVSLVAFYLDEITRKQGFDPQRGTIDQASTFDRYMFNGLPPQQSDHGPWSFDFGSTSLEPGGTLAAGTYTGTLRFTGWIQLQRRRSLMFGMVPNGDPQDRPDLEIQLSPLVGPQPENSLIQDPANAGITASLTGAGTVNATWWSKGLDLLPAGVSPASPTVGLGWSIGSATTSVQNAGQIVQYNHQTSMLYQKIIHILVVNSQVVDADYFGLWLTGEQQNARWEYDAPGLSNFPAYYAMLQRTYQRFLPKGVFVADLVDGEVPFLPQETPYNGAMSPDESYASAFGVPFTPSMATALRIPSSQSISGTTYFRTYTLGMVEVPY